MLPFEDTTSLSLLYHLNSEPWENAEAYGNTMYEVDYKEYSDAMGGLPLPVAEDSASLRLLRVRVLTRKRMQSELCRLAGPFDRESEK